MFNSVWTPVTIPVVTYVVRANARHLQLVTRGCYVTPLQIAAKYTRLTHAESNPNPGIALPHIKRIQSSLILHIADEKYVDVP